MRIAVIDADLIGEKSAAMRYLRDFESRYPEIAREYFDMKYEEVRP